MYTSTVSDLRRYGLVAVFALALIGLGLTAPAFVAACLCAGELPDQIAYGPDHVVFEGTVIAGTELPARDVPGPGRSPDPGTEVYQGGFVYTFDVHEVVHGDPGDGRVYTPGWSGSCGREFQLGAPYRVYAEVVDPDARWIGGTPTVPLATGLCSGGEQLGPPNPLIALTGLGIGDIGFGQLCTTRPMGEGPTSRARVGPSGVCLASIVPRRAGMTRTTSRAAWALAGTETREAWHGRCNAGARG